MSFKIAGEARVDKQDGIFEWDDHNLIGSVVWASDAVEFPYDVTEQLEESDEISQLPDGNYHVFFIGEATISGYDYGDGYESELELELTEIYTQDMAKI